jgi:hypothetical protein
VAAYGSSLGGSSTWEGGAKGTYARHNLVAANRARDNQPADLIYDGTSSGTRLTANDSANSIPDGLCG